jgi:ATP-binding cassette, subfamily B, bacterial PglK
LKQEQGILSIFKKLYGVFSHRQRQSFNRLVGLTFVGSVTDLVGLGLLIPVMGLVFSETAYLKLVTVLPSLSGYDRQQLMLYTIGLFFVFIIAKNLFSLYINRRQVNFVRDVFLSTSRNLIQNIYNRPYTKLQEQTSQDVINTISYLPSALCSTAMLPMLIILNESIVFLLTVILVAAWNWQLLVLLMVVLVPVFGVFYRSVKQTIKEAGKEKNKGMVRLNAHVQQMILGYTDIKVAGTEDNFKDQFNKQVEDFSNYQRKADFLVFVPSRIIELSVFVCAVAILLYGVFVLKDMDRIITTISLFSVIAYRITPSVNRIASALHNINTTEFIFRDEQFLKDLQPVNVPEAVAVSFTRQISFDNVSFHYPGEGLNVLQACNIHIQKGERVGIIGSSGAGKSTLVKLLLGYLQPTEGSVSVDDSRLNTDAMRAWWKLLGYVRQDVYIINASLVENIALGVPMPDVDMQRLQHAISISCLQELVDKKPEGIHTVLGEGGNTLSGGQKQRIAIARAVYKGAQVLIFDEATSALDNKTEEDINESIHSLAAEHLTVIVIAHRYSSLKYCNRILELKGGTVSNTYTYEEIKSL